VKQPKGTSASVGIAVLSIARKICVNIATPFILLIPLSKNFQDHDVLI